MGTNHPTLVDVKFWAHLADALCDAHLVVLLASYPRLVRYFQDIYNTYFTTRNDDGRDSDWKDWNEKQNRKNAFQNIPSIDAKHDLKSNQFQSMVRYENVTDLMQKLSLRKQDLVSFLQSVKSKRDNEPVTKNRDVQSQPFYRWCMGDESMRKQNSSSSLTSRSKSYSDNDYQNTVRKKLMREQKRNDELWLSAVIGISAAAIFLIQNRQS